MLINQVTLQLKLLRVKVSLRAKRGNLAEKNYINTGMKIFFL